MSVEAMTYVFRHSPYSLGFRLVHLSIADVANDGNGCRIWLSQAAIAAKANVSIRTVGEAMGRMVQDGHLEVVDRPAGKSTIYRFLMPTPANSAQVGPTPANSSITPPQSGVPTPSINSNEHKRTESVHSQPSSDRPMTEIAAGLRDALQAGRRG